MDVIIHATVLVGKAVASIIALCVIYFLTTTLAYGIARSVLQAINDHKKTKTSKEEP